MCDHLDDELDGSDSYLRADLSIDCNGASRGPFLAYASVMLIIWPFGVPLLVREGQTLSVGSSL